MYPGAIRERLVLISDFFQGRGLKAKAICMRELDNPLRDNVEKNKILYGETNPSCVINIM